MDTEQTKFSARKNDRERLIMVITLKSGVQLRVGVASVNTIVSPEGRMQQLHTEPDPTSDRHLGWVDMREITAITVEYVPEAS
jgi:hypothetical protein